MLKNFDKPAWLYITTNLITGKKYIGQTTSTRKNYFGSGKIILDAIRKYGKKNFTKEIIYSGTWEEVDLLEAMYIEKYDAINSDEYYNLKEGGTLEGIILTLERNCLPPDWEKHMKKFLESKKQKD